ncbi:MAG: TonB-dependent receptor plug domain-containing protein, partial [Thermaurantiacus sp.]
MTIALATARAAQVSAAACAVLLGSGIQAQEAGPPVQGGPTTAEASEADTILVTARRREERLEDVPVAITLIDAQSLEQRGGVVSALELLEGQTAVRFSNTASNVNSEASIRGSSTARGTAAESAVGLYRNG